MASRARRLPPTIHGTRSAYVGTSLHRPCHCPECTAASRAYVVPYQRARTRAMRRPDEAWLPMVSAARVRRHIEGLRVEGLSLPDIARATSVRLTTIQSIIGTHGPPTARTHTRIARAVLALGADAPLPMRGAVDGTPTQALLEALAAEGISRRRVAALTGMPGIRRPIGTRRVRGSTARAVAELHRQVIPADPDPVYPIGAEGSSLFESIPPHPAWPGVARCSTIPAGDAFFPGRGDDSTAARAVCAGCVVRSHCLDYALAYPFLQGIYGGTTAQERREMGIARRGE